MQVYVVVEMFKGEKLPVVRGVYTNKIITEQTKNDLRFAYIDEQRLIQSQSEKEIKEVFVVIELLKLNVPRIVAVFKSKEHAEEIVANTEYETQIIEEKLI